jgi:hypothetical protein
MEYGRGVQEIEASAEFQNLIFLGKKTQIDGCLPADVAIGTHLRKRQ